MKRKRLLCWMGILSLGILLTGCESKQVKTAKEQFENKNYAEVVSALENEDLKDEEIVKIYNISQAYLCFADGAYDSVVELLSSIETDSPELVNMLAISNANIAFNNKKYQEVVSYLADITDESTEYILNVSQAYLAFEENDYQAVVTILENEEELDSDTNNIVAISEAHLLYDEKKYVRAFQKMQTVENYVDMDFYEEIWKAAVDRFVKKCDYEKLIKIYEGDQLITSYTIEKITKACDGLEYSAFELLDNLVNNIADGDLKEQLLDYSSKNEFNRVRSFLLGSWEWESDADTDTQVKVHSYQDNILAEVTRVGENEIEYQLMVGDIYWKDLVLLGDGSFTCTNLCKTTDAIVVECTALVKIDYDNNILNFHLTAPEPYIMVNPDRTWIRL